MSESVDPILAAAEAKKSELLQEIKKVNDFIASYHTFARLAKMDSENTTGTFGVLGRALAQLEKQVTIRTEELEAEARQEEAVDATPARRPRTTDNPKPDTVVRATKALIREIGQPLTRRQIRDELAERGVVVNGADPVKALGTMLWRSGSEELIQLEGFGYWPIDDDYPPAKYVGRLRQMLS